VLALHVTLAAAATISGLIVVVIGAWSAIAGRRSGGRHDHRTALDRAVLLAWGTAASAGIVGVILLLTGSRTADPLHLIYGPAALIALPIAVWFGWRTPSADGSRVRRDLWTAAGGVVLLGILFRLYATG
jgi:hypothetical protein